MLGVVGARIFSYMQGACMRWSRDGSGVCVNIMSNNLVRYLHVFEPTQHQRRHAIVGEMGVHIYF